MYLDAMQQVYSKTAKILVDVEGGSNMLYLPLDKLVQQTALEGDPGKNLSASDINNIANRVIENINLRAQPSSAPRREPRK